MAMRKFSRVVVDNVPDLDPYDELFEYGLADAVRFSPIADLDCLPPDHPALLAWTQVENEVLEELGPTIAGLVTDAFRRRLPWTWEPEQ
jgi:hypothetical protein